MTNPNPTTLVAISDVINDRFELVSSINDLISRFETLGDSEGVKTYTILLRRVVREYLNEKMNYSAVEDIYIKNETIYTRLVNKRSDITIGDQFTGNLRKFSDVVAMGFGTESPNLTNVVVKVVKVYLDGNDGDKAKKIQTVQTLINKINNS